MFSGPNLVLFLRNTRLRIKANESTQMKVKKPVNTCKTPLIVEISSSSKHMGTQNNIFTNKMKNTSPSTAALPYIQLHCVNEH